MLKSESNDVKSAIRILDSYSSPCAIPWPKFITCIQPLKFEKVMGTGKRDSCRVAFRFDGSNKFNSLNKRAL